MASLQQDPSGNFHICFRFGGKRFKRSLKTTSKRKADAACTRLDENIRLLEAGRMTLPGDADPATFLLSDGKLDSKPKLKKTIRLGDLCSEYKAALPDGALENGSPSVPLPAETKQGGSCVDTGRRLLIVQAQIRFLPPQLLHCLVVLSPGPCYQTTCSRLFRECGDDSQGSCDSRDSLELGVHTRIGFVLVSQEGATLSKTSREGLVPNVEAN